jgi:transcription termination factor Rho
MESVAEYGGQPIQSAAYEAPSHDGGARASGGEQPHGGQPGQQPRRAGNPGGQGQRPQRDAHDPRAARPMGRPNPALGAVQPGSGTPMRTRFDRPGQPAQRPGQPRDQRQGHGDHPRDRRQPQSGRGMPTRQMPPQRGQGNRPAQTGRNGNQNQRGNQQHGVYGQMGYIVPGYGVQGYGNQQHGGHNDRNDRNDRNQQRQNNQQRMRAPVPAQPQVPARLVEVRGVLWIKGNAAELLDERGTLQSLATVPYARVQQLGLRSGDVLVAQAEERGVRRQVTDIATVNNRPPEQAKERPTFEQLTAISPRERITLEHGARPLTSRIIDLFAPLGFGARALVVAPPKTGKTTFLRETAESVLTNYPDVLVMACLVGERPEEVTDLRGALEPRGGLVYAASFDEVQERHAWLVQVTVERAKRVAEMGGNVVVLLDSLTRLARAENLTGRSMGRTLSGGIDAQALDTGRRAFGAARCLEEGGSLTIMATCLVDTGSRQDDVVYEEFKGTGNMEIYLSRELSQRRLFPAVDAVRSGTRKEELLLTPEELRATTALRRRLADMPLQQATTQLLGVLERTPSNEKLLQAIEASGWAGVTR